LLPAARAIGNEDPPALIGDDEPFVTQEGHGVVDGHRCNPVLAGQVAPRWQLLAGRELPLRDLAAQVIGLVPGACKGKAHSYDHLGYAGRRVLVSRKWSGKTLADHRGDRWAWLTEMLGLSATDPASYRWERVDPADEDYMPSGRRLLRSVADRLQWENALTEARRRAQEALVGELSATGRAA
jgi:hypothetical protein